MPQWQAKMFLRSISYVGLEVVIKIMQIVTSPAVNASCIIYVRFHLHTAQLRCALLFCESYPYRYTRHPIYTGFMMPEPPLK